MFTLMPQVVTPNPSTGANNRIALFWERLRKFAVTEIRGQRTFFLRRLESATAGFENEPDTLARAGERFEQRISAKQINLLSK